MKEQPLTLQLNKETVQTLTDNDLRTVHGGAQVQSEVTDFHISTYCDTSPGSCHKDTYYTTC